MCTPFLLQDKTKCERCGEKHKINTEKKEVNAIMNLTPPSLEASLNEDNAVAPTNNSISLIRSEMFSSFGFSAFTDV